MNSDSGTLQRLGIDTGGTFTDFVLYTRDAAGNITLRTHKCASTPDDPARAILTGLRTLGLAEPSDRAGLHMIHGTTVATNAALQLRGARTVYVTNEGLEDTLLLARQARPEVYDLTPEPDDRPIDATLCFGVPVRRAADGSVVTALTDAALAQLRERVAAARPEAIAVNLLFSWLDDEDERRIAAALADLAPVTCASALLPEAGEYERGMATWLNAWLTPETAAYLERLSERLQPTPLEIMHSAGGTLPVASAARQPARLILSGPAGGMTATRLLQTPADGAGLLTFDMGGTSTDVGLVTGEVALTTATRVGPFPLAIAMLDIHTIGAGGGSIARLGPGDVLTVGPQSAGADPGPACYGRGGTEPTVTDAHVVLDHLPAGLKLAGAMPLDTEAAHRAVARLGAAMSLDARSTARGILELTNQHMTRALRVMSVERGVDPRTLTLVCFGGAGGLHLCDLADAMDMRRARVPRLPGTLSALGMVQAVPERQVSRSVMRPLADHADVQTAMDELVDQARSALAAGGWPERRTQITASADLRYVGQTFTLNLPWGHGDALAAAFGSAHAHRYGHELALPIEIVTLRVRGFAVEDTPVLPAWPSMPAPSPEPGLSTNDQPCFARSRLGRGEVIEGPCLVVEDTATTRVASGWRLEVDAAGHLNLTRLT